jgi:hypothetical protein
MHQVFCRRFVVKLPATLEACIYSVYLVYGLFLNPVYAPQRIFISHRYMAWSGLSRHRLKRRSNCLNGS